MAPGFHISEVRFKGDKTPDAVVTLAPGLTVFAGPSNTGKSLLRAAINFVFGSSDPMKTVEEAAPYHTILVEVRATDGTPITFERAWNGGAIRQYHATASDITPATPSLTLAPKHAENNEYNISTALLTIAGLNGKRLRKNQQGVTRNLSFRDLVEYLLVSEERIITELSPIHTASYTDKTAESSLFRTLLTGNDDKDIIPTPPPKELKAQAVGREQFIEQLKNDLLGRIPDAWKNEQDAKTAAAIIDAKISSHEELLKDQQATLTELNTKRHDLHQEHERTLARITQIDGNLKRFDLLSKQYESDLKRLQSNVEAGDLLGSLQEGPCPVCGADPEHHKQHSITQEELDDYTNACRAEAEKIQARTTDLDLTMTQLTHEQTALIDRLKIIKQEQTTTASSLRAVLEPNIAILNEGISTLVEQRRDIERALQAHEELQRLTTIAETPTPKPVRPSSAFTTLPASDYEDFAKTVEELLRAWSFPELDRVIFDTAAEDLTISGKARKDNGKGYRALTYAAFMIGLLQETQRKNLPHPGFVLLDSPLVTYREPTEHIGEGVKNAFYRHLATTLGDAQVIVLENEEPPEELKAMMSYTGFTKNRTTGRYGLFPPLPVNEQQ